MRWRLPIFEPPNPWRLPVGLDVTLEEELAGLINDADEHRFRVKIDPAIETALLGVESRRAPSCEDVIVRPSPTYPGWGG